ncbi:MAG TPA: hypothetical protein VFO38_02700 [Candidatus Saccharimonadales bacterium]|nr:hypothetical protein [Candidatus Saccharimonadales bacterium]
MHGMFVVATFPATRVTHNIIEEYRTESKYAKLVAFTCLFCSAFTFVSYLFYSKTSLPIAFLLTGIGVIMSVVTVFALLYMGASYLWVRHLLKKKRAYLLNKHFEGLLDFVLSTYGQHGEKNSFLRWVAADKERYNRLITTYLKWRDRLPQNRTQTFESLSGRLASLVQDYEGRA